MSYVVVNLSLFVVICTARQDFLFCNKVIIIIINIMANKFRIFGSVSILIFFIIVQHLLSCDNVTSIKRLTNIIHTFVHELYYFLYLIFNM